MVHIGYCIDYLIYNKIILASSRFYIPRLSLSTMVSIQLRYGTCPLLVDDLLTNLTLPLPGDRLYLPLWLGDFSLPRLLVCDRLCKLSLLSFSDTPGLSLLGGVLELDFDIAACLPYCWSVTITCSRWCSERLMCLASWRIRPSAPVFATRSEPAKSTRFSLDL